MSQLIFLQLLLKPVKIDRYNSVSKCSSWSLFCIFAIISNIDMLTFGATLSAFVVMILIAAISMYSAYIIMRWWMVRQKYWDGKGNLFALIMSASIIDLLFPVVIPFGFIATVMIGIFSFIVFFKAVYSGFSLSLWQTFSAIGMATVGITLANIILITIADMLGILA